MGYRSGVKDFKIWSHFKANVNFSKDVVFDEDFVILKMLKET